MNSPLKLAANGLIDILFPPVCLLCQTSVDEGSMCEACFAQLAHLQPPFCPECGEGITPIEVRCRECEAGTARPYDWLHSAGAYNDTLRHAIAIYKYSPKGALAQPLGRFLLQSLNDRPIPLVQNSQGETKIWTVVPVPLHPSRFRNRGFNQAERLAQIVADRYHWTLDSTSIRRTRKTRQQAGGLNRSMRSDNVANAFTVVSHEAFQGQSVLIVDDVTTTLATMNSVAHEVRNGGAKEIAYLTLARG